jgi:uncharacterized protein YjiS (DUF1127 family)
MSDNSVASLFMAHGVRHSPASAWFRLRCWLRATMRVIVTRRQLAEMDDRMLSDIGISRADAWAEASRPFWDQRRKHLRP